jgi:UDP-2,4-diacetamido-2,4,6-trideoxy-beta-L-altropyranose hydrolase
MRFQQTLKDGEGAPREINRHTEQKKCELARRQRLLIRADASEQIGAGHVMRSLALAQAWQDSGGAVCLAARLLPKTLGHRLSEEKIEIRQLTEPSDDAQQTVELAREIGADWVILDGYQFSAQFQRSIKDAGLRLLVVDDNGGAGHYVADLVLNQAWDAKRDLYPSRGSGTALLLGTRYALLRREFSQARPTDRPHAPRAQKLLVTLGGGDPDNCTRTILEAVAVIENLTTVAVVGPSNPRAMELEQLAQRAGGRINVQRDPPDISPLMAWADLAVSGAGNTCWELAFMGLPMLLVVLAENQRPGATSLTTLGLARNLGWHRELSGDKVRVAVMHIIDDPALRASMSRKGLALLDGRGASRVVTEMLSRLFTLRRVGTEDSQLLLEWVNEPGVRAASFSSAPISADEHHTWFERKMRDPACAFFLAIDQRHTPVGQVRFDQESIDAVISVSIDRKFRGRGAGAAVISLACRQLFKETSVRMVHAYVKSENAASVSAFVKAGFTRSEPAVVNGRSATHFVLRREDCAP